MLRVLIVDDDEATRNALAFCIRGHVPEAKIDQAIDEETALQKGNIYDYSLIIVDAHLAGNTYGPDFVYQLRGLGYTGVIAMNTSDESGMYLGLINGANAGFLKPNEGDQIEGLLYFTGKLPGAQTQRGGRKK